MHQLFVLLAFTKIIAFFKYFWALQACQANAFSVILLVTVFIVRAFIFFY